MSCRVENMISNLLLVLFLLSAPTTVLTDSHSMQILATYIKGVTPFPEFSVTFMLDDITVGHFNSDTEQYFTRDNTTNEDETVSHTYSIAIYARPFLAGILTFENNTQSLQLYQMISHCELLENDKSGQMITKFAFSGSTINEIHFHDNKLTHQSTNEMATLFQEYFKWRYESVCYPSCITILRNYIKKRWHQVKRKVKPRVRLFQKALDSGGVRVSCLATGFYPRHINLTLLRDGQPVSDHEVTGGDLLPNGDGTYQMRKSLEIRAEEREKHKYTCAVKHLSIDNKLEVALEFDPGVPFKSVIPTILTVLSLVLVFITGVVIYKCRNRRADQDCGSSSKVSYSSASTSEECIDAITQPQQQATEISETLSN
ncbi:major histocompatibility complex class I-related gene protein-like [Danio aesculapii]|uniref:major histocompatibility complex class I-related gene protein-like n=1 Tax=Danio aesculapii TaxID=1142201 RepID=UPI0024C0D062|nr:major histocompatibility complex class I-related gene protein-like [Danio aesculapii]